ncbi:hypothetical protein [Moraxella nasicaprae]|nr:hypothetical protein [Moraxella nasicaprae]
MLSSEIGAKLLAKWGISVDLPACEPMGVGGKRRLIVPAFF